MQGFGRGQQHEDSPGTNSQSEIENMLAAAQQATTSSTAGHSVFDQLRVIQQQGYPRPAVTEISPQTTREAVGADWASALQLRTIQASQHLAAASSSLGQLLQQPLPPPQSSSSVHSALTELMQLPEASMNLTQQRLAQILQEQHSQLRTTSADALTSTAAMQRLQQLEEVGQRIAQQQHLADLIGQRSTAVMQQNMEQLPVSVPSSLTRASNQPFSTSLVDTTSLSQPDILLAAFLNRGQNDTDEMKMSGSASGLLGDGAAEQSRRGTESGTEEEHESTFPFKLYRMIAHAEREGKEDVISFYPDSNIFGIHKPEQFVTDIMPLYFTTNRLSSFQRQLNLYGFKRVGEGIFRGGFRHQYFIKGRPELCKKILRKKHVSAAAADFADDQAPLPGANALDLGTALSMREQRQGLSNNSTPNSREDILAALLQSQIGSDNTI